MSLSSGPNLGLLVNGAIGEEHYNELMRMWRGLDALIQANVLDTAVNTPPVSPSDGDCYIVATGGTGAWTGKDGLIARYSSVLSAWEFYTPRDGWRAYAVANQEMYRYQSSAWHLSKPVEGPNGITDGDIAQFDGTTGKLIKGGVSLDNDATMVADSATRIATQAATKGYVDTTLTNYVPTSALGSSVQPYDADLAEIAALVATDDDIIQRKSGVWTNRSKTQYAFDLQGDGLSAVTVGFRGIPVNPQSQNYTFVPADVGRCVYHPPSDTASRVYTIPSNASVALPIGAAITIDNDIGAGVLTITCGDTLVLVGTAGLTGTRTLASGGQATAVKVAATRWRISGVGLS